jgi:hypothetical protein
LSKRSDSQPEPIWIFIQGRVDIRIATLSPLAVKGFSLITLLLKTFFHPSTIPVQAAREY